MALTTNTWIGTANADWGDSPSNWSRGFPNSNSNVVINTSSKQTIGDGGNHTYVVNSLTVGNNDVLDMAGGSLTPRAGRPAPEQKGLKRSLTPGGPLCR